MTSPKTGENRNIGAFSRHLYCVFTYIHILRIDKDVFECQNILVKFPGAVLSVAFIGDLFVFSVRVSLFITNFVLSALCTFFFHLVNLDINITPMLMEPIGSMLYLQGLSNNLYPD